MGLNIKKSYEVNSELEKNGKWFDIGNGAKLKIARMNFHNKRWLDAYNESRKLFDTERALGVEISPEAIFEAEATPLAVGILVDWKGIVDDNNNEIPYSVETAKEYLMIADFRDEVYARCNSRENYLKALNEVREKNLETSSVGKHATAKT